MLRAFSIVQVRMFRELSTATRSVRGHRKLREHESSPKKKAKTVRTPVKIPKNPCTHRNPAVCTIVRVSMLLAAPQFYNYTHFAKETADNWSKSRATVRKEDVREAAATTRCAEYLQEGCSSEECGSCKIQKRKSRTRQSCHQTYQDRAYWLRTCH